MKRPAYLLIGIALWLVQSSFAAEPSLRSRVAGLLYGAAIGDALGGPVEFQKPEDVAQLPNPPKQWKPDERLDEAAKEAAIARLRLRPYAPLRPKSDSYGQWGDPAPTGTITDDTRHKLVLLAALREQPRPLDPKGLAKAYLNWPAQGIPGNRGALITDWLEEWRFASAWVLGERDPATAKPPERLWQGLPTCCGQMTSLPLAALYPGKPNEAYQACYQLSFFDNGWGKDVNAALVAGLANSLSGSSEATEAWPKILQSMRETDPYHYGQIRYTSRHLDHWLDLAEKLAREAENEPARLFSALESTFEKTIKWEAQVPLVVAMSCLSLADFDPLVALQLSIEWGHDTDSYAALVGAFIGAIHGLEIFPETLRSPVHERLIADFGSDLMTEAAWLTGLVGKAPVKLK